MSKFKVGDRVRYLDREDDALYRVVCVWDRGVQPSTMEAWYGLGDASLTFATDHKSGQAFDARESELVAA